MLSMLGCLGESGSFASVFQADLLHEQNDNFKEVPHVCMNLPVGCCSSASDEQKSYVQKLKTLTLKKGFHWRLREVFVQHLNSCCIRALKEQSDRVFPPKFTVLYKQHD